MNKPIVTCLCLTMEGRGAFLRTAVSCYRKQTYLDRTMLIISDADGDLDELADCRTFYAGEGQGFAAFTAANKLNIGQKRNLGCEIARTPYIAIWDDDDWSAPQRIWQQLTALEESGKAVTGYSSMKLTDGLGWWQFSCAPGFVLGTSLLFRRDWWMNHPFPEIQVGEDAGFSWEAHEAGQLLALSDSGMMYATIHEGNTSRRKTDQAGFTMLST